MLETKVEDLTTAINKLTQAIQGQSVISSEFVAFVKRVEGIQDQPTINEPAVEQVEVEVEKEPTREVNEKITLADVMDLQKRLKAAGVPQSTIKEALADADLCAVSRLRADEVGQAHCLLSTLMRDHAKQEDQPTSNEQAEQAKKSLTPAEQRSIIQKTCVRLLAKKIYTKQEIHELIAEFGAATIIDTKDANLGKLSARLLKVEGIGKPL